MFREKDDEPFLIHAGVMLQDSRTIEYYQVTGNSTIDVVYVEKPILAHTIF